MRRYNFACAQSIGHRIPANHRVLVFLIGWLWAEKYPKFSHPLNQFQLFDLSAHRCSAVLTYFFHTETKEITWYKSYGNHQPKAFLRFSFLPPVFFFFFFYRDVPALVDHFNPVKVIFISGNVFSTMKNMGEGGGRAPPAAPPGRSLMSDDNIRLENCPQNFSWLPKLHFAISRGYSTRTVRTSWGTHNNATERLKKVEMTNCFRLTHQVWNKEFTAELM